MDASQRNKILASALIPIYRVAGLAGLLFLCSCGGAGVSESSSEEYCGYSETVTGSITSQANGQSLMSGWLVALIERDTQIARVGEIDNAGIFSLNRVCMSKDHTLALLSSDFILQSVLAHSSPVDKTVRQYFRISTPYLPRLIHKGSIAYFQEEEGITFSDIFTKDNDADGLPDAGELGSSLQQAFMLTAASSQVDTDRDGVPNYLDPDIDGDGYINVFDDDDDGDGILDVFDPDVNGDLINDEVEPAGDQYFSAGIKYLGVKYEIIPDADGSGDSRTLSFFTELHEGIEPESVSIRGAPTLLRSATVTNYDESGNAMNSLWTSVLDDDGFSGDSKPKDGIFAKTINLRTGVRPRSKEVLFFQLGFDLKTSKAWRMEFPFMFPDVTPASITTNYTASTRTVRLEGNPFGKYQDFQWSVNLYSKNGKTLLWNSDPISGRERSAKIPSNLLADGEEYTYSAVAQVLDKVPGYPMYVIHSMRQNVE